MSEGDPGLFRIDVGGAALERCDDVLQAPAGAREDQTPVPWDQRRSG